MPRLSSEEQRIKTEVAQEVFENIKTLAIEKGVNTFTWPSYIKMINNHDKLKIFSTGISPSTVKQPKTPELKLLKNEIDEFVKNFSFTKSMISDKVKDQLNSSLDANYILTEKIDNLTEQLKAKDKELIDADNRIRKLLETIKQLQNISS